MDKTKKSKREIAIEYLIEDIVFNLAGSTFDFDNKDSKIIFNDDSKDAETKREILTEVFKRLGDYTNNSTLPKEENTISRLYDKILNAAMTKPKDAGL